MRAKVLGEQIETVVDTNSINELRISSRFLIKYSPFHFENKKAPHYLLGFSPTSSTGNVDIPDNSNNLVSY